MEIVLLGIKFIAINQSLKVDTHIDDVPLYHPSMEYGLKEIKIGGNEKS